MKKLFLLLLVLCCWAAPARAQNVNLNCFTGTAPNQWNPASTTNPCPVVLQGGSGIVGKVGIDQTTPGNTNGVAIAPSSATGVGVAPVVCGSAVNNCVLKATPGNLYAVYAECSAACWLMIFNSTAAQSNGSTTAGIAANNLVECVPIAAGGVGGVNYSPGPPAIYTTGITAMISSTTCATLTTSTVGFVHGMVQ